MRSHAATSPRREAGSWLAGLHGLLLLGLLTLPLLGPPQLRAWPWYLLVPLGLYGLAVLAAPTLRRTAAPFALGRLGGRVVAAVLGVAAAAAGVLVLSDALLHFNLAWVSARLPSGLPAMVAFLGLIVAANAALEELVWRGILYTALAAWVGPLAALLVQALGFGLSHWFFFSPAWAAAALSFVYGLALGGLRWQAGGLLAPFLAHALTDLALATLVVLHVVDPGSLYPSFP